MKVEGAERPLLLSVDLSIISIRAYRLIVRLLLSMVRVSSASPATPSITAYGWEDGFHSYL